jgi:hypothetical protein
MWQLAPKLAAAAGSYSKVMFEEGTVRVRERELARMRIAQINACPIWLDTRTASGTQPTEDEYAAVENYDEIDSLTDRERLAVEFALAHTEMGTELFDRMLAHFSDADIVESFRPILKIVNLHRLSWCLTEPATKIQRQGQLPERINYRQQVSSIDEYIPFSSSKQTALSPPATVASPTRKPPL